MSATLAACAPVAKETAPAVATPPPAPAPAAPSTPPPGSPTASYETLLAAAQARPEEADFGALRMAYARSAQYQPYARYPDDQAPMQQALNDKDWPGVLRIVEAGLARNWVRIRPHFYAILAHEGLGDARAAAHHRAIMRGLARSIMESGDGQSPATAMVVISIQEEYDVLTILGLQRTRQSLVNEGGRAFDRLDVQDREGRESALFFDVTLLLARSPFGPPPR